MSLSVKYPVMADLALRVLNTRESAVVIYDLDNKVYAIRLQKNTPLRNPDIPMIMYSLAILSFYSVILELT